MRLFTNELTEAILGDLATIPIKMLADGIERSEFESYFKHLGEITAQHVALVLDGEHSSVSGDWLLVELKQTLDSAIDPSKLADANCRATDLLGFFRAIRPLDPLWSEDEKQAYDRGLQVAAFLLEKIAFQLPEVPETVTRKLLFRVGALEETVKRVVEDAALIERLHVGRAEKDYRLRVIDSENKMELFGAGLDRALSQYPLTVSYISIRLKSSATSEASNAAEIFLDGLAPNIKRLLIIGVAGSGKSTLLRWMVVTAARRTMPLFEQWRKQVDVEKFLFNKRNKTQESTSKILNAAYDRMWRTRIPFLIRMRDVFKDGLPVPSELGTWLASKNGHLPISWVKNVLDSQNALVLFDGFDEIPADKRSTIAKSLRAICQQAGDNLIVISSRPMPGELEWTKGLEFREANLDFLSNSEKGQLIDNWFEAYACGQELMGEDGASYRQQAKALRQSLFQNIAANDLARVPLLCALLCALYVRASVRELPSDLPGLCERICKMLIHERAKEYKLPVEEFGPIYNGLSYSEKRTLLQTLAITMVSDGESQLEFNHAKIVVKNLLQGRCGEYEAEPFLQTLILLCGLLQHGEGNSVAFIHNTIKEFLAAEVLATNHSLIRLTKNPSDPTWQNIVQIVAASNRDIGIDIVKRLLDHERFPKGLAEQRDAELLALRCRSLIAFPGDYLTKRFNEVQESYIPPENDFEATAIATGGIGVVDQLRFKRSRDEQTTHYCIQALRLIDHANARDALEEYAKLEIRLFPLQALAQFYNPLLITAIAKYVTNSLDHRIEKLGRLTSMITDEHFEQLDRSTLLLEAKELNLAGARVSNLENFRKLINLESLDLHGTLVEDISPVSELKNLRNLSLNGTQVRSIAPLAGLKNLEILDIDYTNVTDLRPLKGINRLRLLVVPEGDLYGFDELASSKQLTTRRSIQTPQDMANDASRRS